MHTSRIMTTTVTLLLTACMAVALLLASGCTGTEESTDETVSEPEAVTPAEDDAVGPTDDGDTADQSDEPETPETITVFVYFTTGDNAFAVERTVPYTVATASASMKQLLMGPSAAEQETWPLLSTAIPAGTELLGVSIADGVALVDLSDEFDDGGGTLSVTMRVAQVVYTLTQFDSIDAVEFYMDGEKVDVFTGEGLILEDPQTPEDYYELAPVDA